MNIFHQILNSEGQLVGYLFGTNHGNFEKITHLSIEVKEAMEASKLICIELDANHAEREKQLLEAVNQWTKTYYNLSHAYLARWPSDKLVYLVNQLRKHPNDIVQCPPMINGAVLLLLNHPQVFDKENMLDEKILQYAHKHKTCAGLESFDFQFRMINGLHLPLKAQYEILSDLIDEMTNMNGSQFKHMQEMQIQNMRDSYFNNRVPTIPESSLGESKYLKYIMQEAIDIRDKEMTKNLCTHIQSLEAEERVFAAVGVLHLPGIRKYLIEKGYELHSISLSERLYPLQDLIDPKPKDDHDLAQLGTQLQTMTIFNHQTSTSNINNINDEKSTSNLGL